jgi:hypothetical protein
MALWLLHLSHANSEWLTVIMGTQIQTQSKHSLGDVSVETDGLAMVVGQVFSQFSVDIVGGEQGIRKSARQF